MSDFERKYGTLEHNFAETWATLRATLQNLILAKKIDTPEVQHLLEELANLSDGNIMDQ